jgi:hypothetical protein
MRAQISLYSADARRFEDYRDQVAEERDGATPDRPELLRMMMDQFDPDRVG